MRLFPPEKYPLPFERLEEADPRRKRRRRAVSANGRRIAAFLWLACILPCFQSLGGATNYVWLAAPSSAEPYDTWDKAATNIHDAVGYASANAGTYDTVLVTNGTYPVTNEIWITNAIKVFSVSGPSNTVVYRSDDATAYRVFCLSNSQALLAGFTITNGCYGRLASAVYVYGGTVSNCIVRLNRGIPMGAGWTVPAVGLAGNGSLLTHSVVEDNSAYDCHGAACGISASTWARVKNCISRRNVMSSDQSSQGCGIRVWDNCLVENCLVTENQSYNGWGDREGGAIYGCWSTIRNCTVSSNTIRDKICSGIYAYYSVVQNCIVHGNNLINATHTQRDVAGYPDLSCFTYSCAPELTSGTGNIDTDPAFSDPWTGNYRLRPGSPCLNTGTNYAGIGAIDLDGNTRIMEGTVDMGAYEGVPAGGTVIVLR